MDANICLTLSWKISGQSQLNMYIFTLQFQEAKKVIEPAIGWFFYDFLHVRDNSNKFGMFLDFPLFSFLATEFHLDHCKGCPQ